MHKNINDYELLYLISENDEVAYNSMYKKYGELVKIEANKLYKKCKYLGISVNDLYQAGLCGLSKAISTYNNYDGVLFFTCANIYINRELQTFIRDKGRNKHCILTDSISLNKEIDNDGTNLFELYASGEDVQRNYESYVNCKNILDLKYMLPFIYSQVYELRLNGFTNKEISTLLDIKYKMVDNAVTKIKTILKNNLNEIELF